MTMTAQRSTQAAHSGKRVCPVVQQQNLEVSHVVFFGGHFVLLFSLRSGLQVRKFPTSNTYMDDPFNLCLTGLDQPIYFNTSILEHKVRSSSCRRRRSYRLLRKNVNYGEIFLHLCLFLLSAPQLAGFRPLQLSVL